MIEINIGKLDKWCAIKGDVKDYDILIVSDDSGDKEFIKDLLWTSDSCLHWGNPLSHKKIICYHTCHDDLELERYRVFGDIGVAAYNKPYSPNTIEVYFLGNQNKQHTLISRLYLSPYTNRACIESSNCAAIYHSVRIEVDKLKIKHYRVI